MLTNSENTINILSVEINDSNECPICYNPIESTDCNVTLCDHKFHSSCLIENVIKNGPSCPICRSSLIKNNQHLNTNSILQSINELLSQYSNENRTLRKITLTLVTLIALIMTIMILANKL